MYVQVWCPVQRSVRSKTKLISKWRRLLTKQEQELWMRARIVCEDSAGLHLHPPIYLLPQLLLQAPCFLILEPRLLLTLGTAEMTF